ncbi:PqqD family peptide modification chaperone [bacterium]|nr:PqqD family peptide modification chaperone [bacterium]
MNDIILESVVHRADTVMASPVDEDLIMMDIDRGMYYALNTVGSSIWERLAQPLKVVDLCTQLQQYYQVDPATCEAHVLALLNDMAANGLLQRQ